MRKASSLYNARCSSAKRLSLQPGTTSLIPICLIPILLKRKFMRALAATLGAAAAAPVAAVSAARCSSAKRFFLSSLMRFSRPPGNSSKARFAPTRHSPATFETTSDAFCAHLAQTTRLKGCSHSMFTRKLLVPR